MPSDTGTPVKPPDPARRNERAHDAILKAAYELWLELGTKHLTIERIAARAGVGKQTIYRWWPSKAAVLLDAWLEVTSVVNPLPDTGDIAADLKSHLGTIIATFQDPKLGPQLRGLVAESQHSEEFAAQVLERLIAPRYALVHERLRSAQQQGQLRDDVDVEIAAEILYGPVYHRVLLSTAPLTPEHATQVVDAALRGLAPHGGSPRSPRRRAGRASAAKTGARGN